MQGETITIAFINKNGKFVPSHVGDIKKNDVYYLVQNGKKGDSFKASHDAELNSMNEWVALGEPIVKDSHKV